MGAWLTAEQVGACYLVGEQRLLEHARRGNLALRRRAGEAVVFDGDGVARLFRLRGAAAGPVKETTATSFGVLGVVRLGEEAAEPGAIAARELPLMAGREARRRALRLAGQSAADAVALARTG
jgi:hypothetical protein